MVSPSSSDYVVRIVQSKDGIKKKTKVAYHKYDFLST
jgi:hypothetical protein